MSSKQTEDIHTELIKKLLIDSGLVCEQSPPFSEESEEEEQQEEEVSVEEAEITPEENIEPEHFLTPEDVVAEEYSNVFPTPSLRRLIPERIRRIEAYNRIKVLPDSFKTEIDPAAIPKIHFTAPQIYIDVLAELTGCSLYKINLAEFWFLDTLANLLRRAQEDELDRPTQAILILWFCEWMKEMQQFDAANRCRMLRRWRDNMLAAAKVIGEEDYLPNPDQAGVFYKRDATPTPSTTQSKSLGTAKSHIAKHLDPKTLTFADEKRSVEFGGYECYLKDLSKIIHYTYDLFSTDFQYDLVRSIFTFGPEYHLIYGPYQIEEPRRLYTVLKPRKEPKVRSPKSKDKGAKPKKKEVDTAEYLKLMQLIDISEKEALEQEERDREDWNKRNSILPLIFAASSEFFAQYWPPPPSEVLMPIVPVPEPPKKGKGKK